MFDPVLSTIFLTFFKHITGTGVAYAVGFLVDPPNSTDNNSSVPLSDIRSVLGK